MFNSFRKIEAFVIVIIIAVIGIIYAFKQSAVAPTNLAVNSDASALSAKFDQTVTYQGQDGRNALDLLKAEHNVGVKSYSFGDMVLSIDGVTPSENQFWAMYINGDLSQVGASAYMTKSTDVVNWRLDEVKDQ